MNIPLRFATLVSAAALQSAGVFAADSAPLPFSEATFTEVVNDVQVVSRADAKTVKAVKDARFTAPDLVKTGRKSRAQLTGADGTIARVGSNAVFAFDKSSRTINLESGSVLFHSPTGKGGGTIVTNSATASVIGTTIIVTATADGGFKLLVLEGVAKVQYPNGQVATVNAGQMTFVMPGVTVENKSDGASGSSSQGDAPAKGGTPGPVLNFDLATLAAGSGLVSGFETELPSLGKIRLATGDQGERLADGELKATGLFIVGARDDKEFIVADPNAVQQAQLLNQTPLTDEVRLDRAIGESFRYDGSAPIPEKYIFRTPVNLLPEMLPAGVTVPDGSLVGVFIGHLELSTSVFNLGFIDGAADELTVAAVGTSTLIIPGDITFNGLAKSRMLRIAGGNLVINPGSKVDVVFDNVVAGSPTKAEFVSLIGTKFSGVLFRNASGGLELGAMLGDLTLENVTAVAGTKGASGLDPARLDLHVQSGSLIVTGGLYSSSGDIQTDVSGDVAVTDANFNASDRVHLVTAGKVTLTAGTIQSANVEILGGTGVMLGGAASVNSSGPIHIAASGGLVDLGDAQLFGTVIGVDGDGVHAGSAVISTSGSVHVDGRGFEVTLAGTTLTTWNTDVSGASLSLTGVTLSSTGGFNGVLSGVTQITTSDLIVGGPFMLSAGSLTVADSQVSASGMLALDTTGTVVLSGATTLNSTGTIRVASSGGFVDLGDAQLFGTGIGVEGDGVHAGSAVISTSGAVHIDGRAFDVTLVGTTIDAGNLNLNGLDITVTGASLNASSAVFIERQPGILANSITVGNTTINAYGVDGMGVSAQLRAGTIALDGVTFSSGALVTLRVASGLTAPRFDGTLPPDPDRANLHNVAIGSVDIYNGNLVWAPAENLGDVSRPFHVLDATTADFRGSKKDYALTTPLGMGVGSFVPHSYEFDMADGFAVNPQTGELLNNSDLGLPAAIMLPDVGSDPSHSAYEVTGIFAANLTLNGATIDFSRFDVDPLVNQYAHADIVASTLNLSGDITVSGLSQTRSLELRATNFNVAPGTVLTPGLAPDQLLRNGDVLIASAASLTLPNFTLKNEAGSVRILSMDTLSVNGGSLGAGTTDGTIGGSIYLEAGSALSVNGGVAIRTKSSFYATATAGDVMVADAATVVDANYVSLSSGQQSVRINSVGTFHAGSSLSLSGANDATNGRFGDVRVSDTIINVGDYQGQGGVASIYAGNLIDLSNAAIAVEDDGSSYTGTVIMDAPSVNLTNSTLKTVNNVNQPATLGRYVEIDASAVVSISGGSLKASDIIVRGRTDYSGQTPVYNLLNRIDVDGVNFMANNVQDGSYRGVFMEAQTINISNTIFPEKTEIRLQSQNGTLNLGSANMFGAVNFVKGVGLGDSINGDKMLVDGSGIPNIANINMAVWVEGHDKAGVNKIFVNGVTPSTLIDGNPSSSSAPIHIQQAVSTQSPPTAGSHPSNFAPGINGPAL